MCYKLYNIIGIRHDGTQDKLTSMTNINSSVMVLYDKMKANPLYKTVLLATTTPVMKKGQIEPDLKLTDFYDIDGIKISL